VLTSSCAFSDDAHGTILCASDAQCPSAQRCDVAHHVCTKPGADVSGPVAVGARFSPSAISSGAVTLTIDANEAVAASPAPVLAFAAGDPGFTLASGAGTQSITFGLVVDHTAPEGFFTLTGVTLADSHGNVASSPVSAVLAIDHTAPSIDILDVSGGIGGVFSDQAGSNVVTVDFVVSEALSSVPAVSISGVVALACAAPQGFAFKCTTTLASGALQNRDNTLTIDASDLAGNTAHAERDITVDVDAPFVVPGSAHLDVDGGQAPAGPGNHIHLELLVSEALASDPVVVVDSPQQIPFTVTARQGLFYSLEADVTDVLAAGTFDITATLVDVFGHTSTAPVALPAPFDQGIELVAFPDSPCDAAPVCPDVDGDGFFGVTPTCPRTALSDCDDGDPLVYPGAPTIFADSKVNDCNASADAPFDETDLVFLSTLGDDNLGDGSRAKPWATLEKALADGRAVVAAAGDYGNTPALGIGVSLQGGFDEAYASVTGVSRFAGDFVFGAGAAPYAVAHVEMNNFLINGPVTVADAAYTDASQAFIGAPARLVRVQFADAVSVTGSAAGTSFLHCAFDQEANPPPIALITTAENVLLDACDVAGGILVQDGDLRVVNSGVHSAVDPAITISGGTQVSIAFSSLIAFSNDIQVGTTASTSLFAGSTIFDFTGSGTANAVRFDGNSAKFQFAHDAFAPGAIGSSIVTAGGGTVTATQAGAQSLDNCSALSNFCVNSFTNFVGAVPLTTNGLRFAVNPQSTVAFHAGLSAANYATNDPDPAGVADEDGDCRFVVDTPNIGPDETP
jgi:hypothetical protein